MADTVDPGLATELEEGRLMPITGRCLCGAVKYAIATAPTATGVCHGRNGQCKAGSAFSTLAGVPKAEVAPAEGGPKSSLDLDTRR